MPPGPWDAPGMSFWRLGLEFGLGWEMQQAGLEFQGYKQLPNLCVTQLEAGTRICTQDTRSCSCSLLASESKTPSLQHSSFIGILPLTNQRSPRSSSSIVTSIGQRFYYYKSTNISSFPHPPKPAWIPTLLLHIPLWKHVHGPQAHASTHHTQFTSGVYPAALLSSLGLL